MTFRQFAFNNVKRNKKLYAGYFLSSLFMVMVFFSFAIFAYHPLLQASVLEDGLIQQAAVGMNVAQVIIYLFSIFFVLYSMSAFLKSRKKEFGLLVMQGISPNQMRKLVFLENIVIGFFATIGGVLLGLVFAKAIMLLAENVLVLRENLAFYFPTRAIITTVGAFSGLFLMISFFVSIVLKSGKPIDLIKGSNKSEGEPKSSFILSILTLLLLGTGYYFAITSQGVEVFLAMIPVIILVIIGTYFLFTQLSVFIIRFLKKRTSIYWKETNMILFSDLSFRMKDNARTFFMVAIISTVAFSAIGTLYGVQNMFSNQFYGISPMVTYSEDIAENEENTANIEEEIGYVDELIADYGINAEKVELIRPFYSINSALNSSLMILTQSQYNKMANMMDEELLSLDRNEIVIAAAPNGYLFGVEEQLDIPLQFLEAGDIYPNRLIESDALGNYLYYIIPDHLQEDLLEEKSFENVYVAWNEMEQVSEETLFLFGEDINSEIDSTKVFATEYTSILFKQSFGQLLFIGLFIGIVFFVCSGSFLYFRLYSDIEIDKQKFKSISRMGLTDRELKRILNRQIGLLFFSPILVALIHGFVALNALSNAFQTNLLKETLTVLLFFAFIQIVYFLVVRHFYIKQVREAIY
ncbi:FtsX-like permease family protein [Alkalihalobacillus trypoxylicola]|uniref:ABC3 transporter permease C-terminal domain-containing protein n=1 Tax=Alkalihalobacillus trypoxylicola TaxID=519424 RepID=A0A162DET9_9BACI|nr:ABC transporter permease [Alkalihalobacillus trypoxylicola]KYG29415.1 hypothetical protein AZF04_07780 [Alkalihalobacillus trypoxylicola]